ncbi:exopolysaccharide production repressor protein [Mesorhizobium argentiipisi]|uniref:exopolysaccharide production repressor protein n=1 Tax=Mesorhizobium argentiipisi TaxID=3015175 RepID=UPI0039F5D7BF
MEASHFLLTRSAHRRLRLVDHCVTSSLVQTALCAVLAQVGYFLAMLCLLWRTEQSSTSRSRPHTTETERLSEVSDDHSGKAG